MGSYIGLLLLGGAFVAIGLFSSSLTNNQIISFIVSAVLCAVIYLGFESIYHMGLFGSADLVVKRIGIMHHYESISRGVVDTRRDLLRQRRRTLPPRHPHGAPEPPMERLAEAQEPQAQPLD